MPKKILIIDDEQDLLRLTATRLEAAGYEVMTAPDGETAFKAIEKNLPDLILLDLMLPRKDGYEICNELKSNEETRNIPVVLFTAKAEEKAHIKSNYGFLAADDYILKPFDPEELLEKIKRLI